MPCIFCHKTHTDTSVEHIIPRVLGNVHYILPKGDVCAACNNRFGIIEQKVLSSKIFYEERLRLGLIKPGHQPELRELNDRELRIFILKMGYEALYKSKRRLWEQLDFTSLLGILMKGRAHDELLDGVNSDLEFRSIPGYFDKWRLKNNHLRLDYARDGEKMYIRFQFGCICCETRLV